MGESSLGWIILGMSYHRDELFWGLNFLREWKSFREWDEFSGCEYDWDELYANRSQYALETNNVQEKTWQETTVHSSGTRARKHLWALVETLIRCYGVRNLLYSATLPSANCGSIHLIFSRALSSFHITPIGITWKFTPYFLSIRFSDTLYFHADTLNFYETFPCSPTV